MDMMYLAVAVVAAVAVSALVHAWLGARLERSVERRLAAMSGDVNRALESFRAASERSEAEEEGHRARHADRLADVAHELVTLARNATDAAIRHEEIHDWHRPGLAGLGDDDIAASIRDQLRRSSLNAVAARSALVLAIRRHRDAIPDELEAAIVSFCDGLNDDGGAGAAARDRRRALALALDALEGRFGEVLGADRLSGSLPGTETAGTTAP